MTTSRPIICSSCTRFRPPAMFDEKNSPTCEAFPEGIPVDILQGADHRESRDGEVTWKKHPLNGHMLAAYERRVEVRDVG